jgi:hypothetical protein
MDGLGQLNLVVGDPVASAEAATAEAPGFVMGHVLRAWLYLLSAEAQAQTPARCSWLAARGLPMTDQEAAQITAIGHLLDGRWHQAARVVSWLLRRSGSWHLRHSRPSCSSDRR